MNLKEIQNKHIINEYVQKCLKEGKTPSYKNINNYINKKFSNLQPGFPTFVPLFARKHDCSNPEEYNIMINNIFNDLSDLYLCDEYCNKELLSLASFYECEKNKVFNKINKIQQKIDSLLVKKEENHQETFIETFDNFLKTDLDNTTAFIDLLTKEVKINSTNFNSKIPLNNAKVSVNLESSAINNLCISNEINCIKDSINEIWLQKVTTDYDTGVKIVLELTLPIEQEITTIDFKLHTARNTILDAIVIDSKGQQRKLKTIKTIGTAEWNIKQTKCKKILFSIYKSEPDGINGINFEYYFGCKNISLYNDTYSEKDIFVSKPYKITEPFNFIKLEAHDILPPDTDIKYYLGIEKDNKDIVWKRIYNNKINDMKILNKNKIIITSDNIRNYGSHNGDIYTLAELPNIPSKKHIVLHIGTNMWERNTADIPHKEVTDMQTSMEEEDEMVKNLYEDDMPENDKQVQTEEIEETIEPVEEVEEEINMSELDFKKIEFLEMNKILFKQEQYTFAIYNTYVYCNESTAIKSNIKTSSEKAKISLYVNSIEIDSELNIIRLAKGWNNIKITSRTYDEPSNITINAYFNDVSDIVRARKEPLEQIPLYKLKNGISKNMYNHFAMNNNKILINYDPKKLNIKANIEYMYYDNSKYFNNFNIRLMAVLRNLSNDVTPKINNYKISTI